MTVKMAERNIKPSGLPQKCSGCFNQDPKAKHVDFDAACDRGWYGDKPAEKVVMDDLVLCEHCIKEGATLIGYTDESKLTAQFIELENDKAQLTKERDEAQEYADKAEDLVVHTNRRRKDG